MTDIEAGESFNLGDVSEATLETPDEEYEYNKKYPMFSEASLTVDFDKCDISSQFEELLGIYLNKFPSMVDLLIPVIVQVHKHKKKRINKKWAKKYGYKQIMRKSKGWELKTHCEDNTFEFVKRE